MRESADQIASGRPERTFQLRPATSGDQAAIRRMVRDARLNPFGLRWSRFIVAVDDEDGAIIGCGQVKPHWDGCRELASIVVRRDWRRRGVAREIIQRLQSANESPLWLMCASPLIPFYERTGFGEVKITAHMPPYFRGISRLSALLFPLFRGVTFLAVMVRTP